MTSEPLTGNCFRVRFGRTKGEVISNGFALANQEWKIPKRRTQVSLMGRSINNSVALIVEMQVGQEGYRSTDDNESDTGLRPDTGQNTPSHIASHNSGSRFSGLRLSDNDLIEVRSRIHNDARRLGIQRTIYSYCNAEYVILGRISRRYPKTFERILRNEFPGLEK